MTIRSISSRSAGCRWLSLRPPAQREHVQATRTAGAAGTTTAAVAAAARVPVLSYALGPYRSSWSELAEGVRRWWPVGRTPAGELPAAAAGASPMGIIGASVTAGPAASGGTGGGVTVGAKGSIGDPSAAAATWSVAEWGAVSS